MIVLIVGAGSVGSSIARELISHGHHITILDEKPEMIGRTEISGAQWIIGDACELSVLRRAKPENCDVIVAATGDDKSNLVVSLLARSEFGVPRTVARVNNPKNEWLFDDSWGIDVAVSTPPPDDLAGGRSCRSRRRRPSARTSNRRRRYVS